MTQFEIPAAPVRVTPVQTQLVGREDELAWLTERFRLPSGARPGLVVVSGDVGFGKSTLLQHARELAAAAGWRTVGSLGALTLSINAETTRSSFCGLIRERLGLALPTLPSPTGPALAARDDLTLSRAVSEAPIVSPVLAQAASLSPESVLKELDQHAETQSLDGNQALGFSPADVLASAIRWLPSLAPPTLQANARRLLDMLLDLGGDAAENTTEVEQTLVSLVEQLRDGPPTALFVDGYAPHPSFRKWLSDSFVGEIRRLAAPVMLVVADRETSVSSLAGEADETIHLGPLPVEPVKRHFEALQARPRIDGEELGTYVEESCKRPELLWILSRVLLIAPESGSPSERLTGSENGD